MFQCASEVCERTSISNLSQHISWLFLIVLSVSWVFSLSSAYSGILSSENHLFTERAFFYLACLFSSTLSCLNTRVYFISEEILLDFILCALVYVCVLGVCGGQRTAYGTQFSFSTMWVLGARTQPRPSSEGCLMVEKLTCGRVECLISFTVLPTPLHFQVPSSLLAFPLRPQ